MTLSLGTAYRSFGGEVEASSTPTICRLPDSRRHQLWAIAPITALHHKPPYNPADPFRCWVGYQRTIEPSISIVLASLQSERADCGWQMSTIPAKKIGRNRNNPNGRKSAWKI